MSKITFWTKKANKETNNCYCDHYLKDKSMMEELGVTTNANIEWEINNGDFSCMIDDLGYYEDLMRKYKIYDTDKLEKILAKHSQKEKRLAKIAKLKGVEVE